MKAVVLAGGKGTRLAPYTKILPKPLMPIGDMPILEVVLRQLQRSGFTRVTLAPGEEKQVMIPVRLKDLDYFDQDLNKWVVEDGPINIMVGGSSVDLPLTQTVNVQGYAKDSSNY